MASTSLTEVALRPRVRLLKVHKTKIFFLIYFYSFLYTIFWSFSFSSLNFTQIPPLPYVATRSFSFSQKRNPTSQNKIKTNNPKKTKQQQQQKEKQMNKQTKHKNVYKLNKIMESVYFTSANYSCTRGLPECGWYTQQYSTGEKWFSLSQQISTANSFLVRSGLCPLAFPHAGILSCLKKPLQNP